MDEPHQQRDGEEDVGGGNRNCSAATKPSRPKYPIRSIHSDFIDILGRAEARHYGISLSLAGWKPDTTVSPASVLRARSASAATDSAVILVKHLKSPGSQRR